MQISQRNDIFGIFNITTYMMRVLFNRKSLADFVILKILPGIENTFTAHCKLSFPSCFLFRAELDRFFFPSGYKSIG